MFFGREDDFEYIRKKVTGGKEGGLLVLCGTRRSGKTSILFQIKGGRLGEGFLPILIDMQAMTVRDDTEFLAKLAREIIAAVDSPDISFKGDYLAQSKDNPFSAFQDLIEVINTKLKGRKLVLMFDEYELFETHISKERFSTDILNLLANWMEHRHGVFIIFTGSDKLEARNKRYWGYFLGKALHRRISFLSRADTLRLANEPLSGIVRYAEGVPEEVYRLTAGQPFYTQVLCQSLVDHLNELRRYDIAADDVESVVKEIIDNPLPQMVFTWSSLTDLEKMCLSALAELSKAGEETLSTQAILSYPKEENLGYRFDSGRLKEAIERLFNHDLLDKDSSGEGYSFKMDLWRRWVMRMHSIWQVVDEVGGEGKQVGEGIKKVGPGSPRSRLLRLGVIAFFGLALVLVGSQTIYRLTMPPENDGTGGGGSNPFAVATVDSTLLTIKTEPPDAMVFLDGRRLDGSQLQNAHVPAKKTTLQIEKAGYRPVCDTLDLLKDTLFDTTIVLEELLGAITVTSRPAGAAVHLNGRDTGKRTPLTLPALSVNSRHEVRLRLSDYSEGVYEDMQVFADSTLLIDHSFKAAMWPLTIRTSPDGADVFLDDRPVGLSPTSLPNINQGRHKLLIKKDGYQEYSSSIAVPVADNSLDIVLAQLPPGTIEFRLGPWADIYINGELIGEGETNRTVERPPGTYDIELRHSSLGTFRKTVRVRSGEETLVDHDFFETRGNQR